MRTRLTLVSSATTPAARRGAFPCDDVPDGKALAGAAALKALLVGADRALVGPERQARLTAEALGLVATPVDALRQQDFGHWFGKGLDEVGKAEPRALAAWLADPAAPPGGGEAFSMVVERVSDWLDGLCGQPGHTVAVAHATVIRAAILAVIGAPAACFARIDVVPLSLTDLRGDGRRWMLRAMGLAAR